MNFAERKVYLDKSLSQIPRILSLMDRSVFSPTYGCCHRDYWLYKTSDFPDAVRQFGIHALSIVYSYELENNPYYKNQKILEWILAGLKYWASIQHNDGSYDEFYPNERGWVGPTAFTTYSTIESFNLIKDQIDIKDSDIILTAIRRAAFFIIKGDSEEDHLANHHAMACLATWKSYKLLKDNKILDGYNSLWRNFKNYHIIDEGWSIEYDGIDPGYLSATVSFLGKIYQDSKNEEILKICKSSIEKCSYFVYPNGFYGGNLGSRNTQHFYSHGFEIFSNLSPVAMSISEFFLSSLHENKLVPPEIMSDRYLFYRVPELLLSYIDYKKRSSQLSKLPFEEYELKKYFEKSKIMCCSNNKYYAIANLAKGGVLKVYDKKTKNIVLNDSGIVGILENGKIVSTQWIDKSYNINIIKDEFIVSGTMNYIPSNKYFNVLKNIIFRVFLISFATFPFFAHKLKGWIRRILMLGNRSSGIEFKRSIIINSETVHTKNEIINNKKIKFKRVFYEGEFFLRYVPQSRFFQSQELNSEQKELSQIEISKLNKGFWSNYS